MAQVLFFFSGYISRIEYGFEVFFGAYRHGLQINTAEASLKIQRVIAQSGYSVTTVQVGGRHGSHQRTIRDAFTSQSDRR